MRRPTRPRTRPPAIGPALGFTLTELLIVMVIIGILIAFILSAAMDGIRRAEERSTQALITKLDAGMSDRVDALLSTRADVYPTHQYLAGVWVAPLPWIPPQPNNILAPFTAMTGTPQPQPNPVINNMRAQIIARFEQVKAELPDVFYVQASASYPLNFAATPFGGATGIANYLLPMGIGLPNDPAAQLSSNPSFGSNPPYDFPYVVVPPATVGNPPTLGPLPAVDLPSTGVYGASYTAAAGLYKSLFNAALLANPALVPPSPANAGFDGVDNNGNGLVDEITENGAVASTMVTLLGNHTHKTARSEMLYALLVNGQGPFGSVFSPDDFRDTEVRDTDGDGLPEFVDSWGEPILYFRWPIFYQSDTQMGASAYTTQQLPGGGSVSFQARQQNTLDPNQTLVDPSWWGGGNNSNSPFASAVALNSGASLSGSAIFFESYFHTLTDPNTAGGAPSFGAAWDRGTSTSPTFCRREYYSRYLILSAGPDKIPGVPICAQSYYDALNGSGYGAISVNPLAGPTVLNTPNLQVESQAAPLTPISSSGNARTPVFYAFPGNAVYNTVLTSDPVSMAIQEAGNDDVTNYNLSGPGGATQ